MIANRAENLLLRPASLAAVFLLALNDHVLKAHAPGFWTGKLSDFAGLYFFPFLLVTISVLCGAPGSRRSLGTACALTALVFSCINLWPEASNLYEQLVTGAWRLFGAARPIRHVADAEDLIALPMAALSYLVGSANLTLATTQTSGK